MIEKLKEHKKIIGIFFVIFVVGALLASLVKAEESNCEDSGEFRICTIELVDSPACHNIADFPTPNDVAKFYGGKTIGHKDVIASDMPGRAFIMTTGDPNLFYVFFLPLPPDPETVVCLVQTMTKLDTGA